MGAPLPWLFGPGFLRIVLGTIVQHNGLRQLGVPFVFFGGLLLLPASSKRRRAGRLVREQLGMGPGDNRLSPTDLPPLNDLAYQSWLRRMQTRPGDQEPDPAFGEAEPWLAVAPPEPILTNSCFRCLMRPKPHDRCGYRDCGCARGGHSGWLGPRPVPFVVTFERIVTNYHRLGRRPEAGVFTERRELLWHAQ